MQSRRIDNIPVTHNSPRWKFKYENENGTTECNLKCMRCIGVNSKGNRCRRKTCYTLPFCWQHLKSHATLKIGQTTLKDPQTGRRFSFRGLFACDPKKDEGEVVFTHKQMIIPYIGEQVSHEDVEALYGDDETIPYGVIALSDDGDEINVDGGCMRGVAALANDVRGTTCVGDGRCRINSKLVSGRGQYPELVATRAIRNGDEIFVSYGEEYWSGDIHQHETSPKSAYGRIQYKC